LSAEAAGARARAEAAICVARVVGEGQTLETALESVRLVERDAALVRALTHGSLRWHQRLTWQVQRLLARPLPARESAIDALIRVGLYQLQFTRIPEHAAVSSTVAAARLLRRPGYAALVNALLRRFLRERKALEAQMERDPQAASAHPGWLLERLQRDWPDRWEQIVAAGNVESPPMWLRVNTRRTSRLEYLALLETAGLIATPCDGVATALLLERPQSVGTLPGFAEGLVSVQDAAAQLACGLLAVGPGQRVLDACAAPGGKAAHLLEAHPDVAELWALDRDPTRVELMRGNFTRLGLAPTLTVGDATQPAGWWDGRAFDRILLDAPCSATGVIRRHPDIKVLRRPTDIGPAAARQALLLRALWPLLKAGGRLLYATCSVLKEENQQQIDAFIAATPDARWAGGAQPHYQILPGEANMDGFYYACLEKQDMVRSLSAS
jgi:16S rRNA (cytosine967-C5)-methyltransferase